MSCGSHDPEPDADQQAVEKFPLTYDINGFEDQSLNSIYVLEDERSFAGALGFASVDDFNFMYLDFSEKWCLYCQPDVGCWAIMNCHSHSLVARQVDASEMYIWKERRGGSEDEWIERELEVLPGNLVYDPGDPSKIHYEDRRLSDTVPHEEDDAKVTATIATRIENENEDANPVESALSSLQAKQKQALVRAFATARQAKQRKAQKKKVVIPHSESVHHKDDAKVTATIATRTKSENEDANRVESAISSLQGALAKAKQAKCNTAEMWRTCDEARRLIIVSERCEPELQRRFQKYFSEAESLLAMWKRIDEFVKMGEGSKGTDLSDFRLKRVLESGKQTYPISKAITREEHLYFQSLWAKKNPARVPKAISQEKGERMRLALDAGNALVAPLTKMAKILSSSTGVGSVDLSPAADFSVLQKAILRAGEAVNRLKTCTDIAAWAVLHKRLLMAEQLVKQKSDPDRGDIAQKILWSVASFQSESSGHKPPKGGASGNTVGDLAPDSFSGDLAGNKDAAESQGQNLVAVQVEEDASEAEVVSEAEDVVDRPPTDTPESVLAAGNAVERPLKESPGSIDMRQSTLQAASNGAKQDKTEFMSDGSEVEMKKTELKEEDEDAVEDEDEDVHEDEDEDEDEDDDEEDDDEEAEEEELKEEIRETGLEDETGWSEDAQVQMRMKADSQTLPQAEAGVQTKTLPQVQVQSLELGQTEVQMQMKADSHTLPQAKAEEQTKTPARVQVQSLEWGQAEVQSLELGQAEVQSQAEMPLQAPRSTQTQVGLNNSRPLLQQKPCSSSSSSHLMEVDSIDSDMHSSSINGMRATSAGPCAVFQEDENLSANLVRILGMADSRSQVPPPSFNLPGHADSDMLPGTTSTGPDADFKKAASFLQTQARRVVVIVGAGASTSAGIPDFRSPGIGLYDNLAKYSSSEYNLSVPEHIFDIEFFQKEPRPFYDIVRKLWPGNYQPTPSHWFLRLLYESGKLARVYTQNFDDLEKQAGIPAEKIVAAHGDFDACHVVGKPGVTVPSEEVKNKLCRDPEGWKDLQKKYGGLVKPNIVLFGESLPERYFNLSEQDLKRCDMIIVMGTSLKVSPFCQLLELVSRRCKRVLINRIRVGPKDYKWDAVYEGDCDNAVWKLCNYLGWEGKLKRLIDGSYKEADPVTPVRKKAKRMR